ncbi:ATP-binding cassette domain-containing protein [Methanospirillum hungatei]|uniref:ATP-binding cassette domain-containing protein n=1 Tax=Methanospirillum hungatei TaxID=2203 RepID=UPI0026EF1D47|nr:ATP-binding cassette domain-containing protein [Methanospirillum hungatei]MCA1915757.1 ATP-binding cassette domain-containing protein [Methanospirillum hungatei]
MNTPLIRLTGVIRKKGAFTLKADAEFGTGIHLLTGRVGSGKTTLGELLAGIGEPDSGTIRWNGGRRVMLLQDTSYHISTMTVQEEAGSWHGDAERIIRTAGLTGKEHTDLLRLSRGEVRRLELAAILTGQYDLIVLDEPWAGLDEEARRWVRQLIDSHAHEIIVIISHDLTSLPHIDQLWEMECGRLKRLGQVPACLSEWTLAPPLVRYLQLKGVQLSGLSREELEEAVCRIPG